MKKNILTCILLMMVVLTYAQSKKVILVPFEVVGRDTFPILNLSEVNFTRDVDAETKMKQQQWAKLMRDIKVVMPYAKACASKMNELDQKMAAMEKHKEKKKLLKEEEKKLRAEFEDKLNNLNVRQGKLLVKLIDRETGHTSYSLIKEYKNGFTAFCYQGFASFFGMTLKDRYDPGDKDKAVECAIQVLGYN